MQRFFLVPLQRIAAVWNAEEEEVLEDHEQRFFPRHANGKRDFPDDVEIEFIILPKLEGLNPDNVKSVAKVKVSILDSTSLYSHQPEIISMVTVPFIFRDGGHFFGINVIFL